MFIIKHKKIFLSISVLLIVISIVLIFTVGIEVGIDFKGGAITEVVYENTRPMQDVLGGKLSTLGFGSVLLQPTGDNGFIVKTRDLNEQEHEMLLEMLSLENKFNLTETGFNSIGPSIGRELAKKAVVAVVLVALAVIVFIAFVFRKVSEPVSSWKYGFIAIVALLHDVIIPIGIFTLLSHYLGAELDALFVVAILTILGLSLSDTIVIFDRIRENLKNLTSINKVDFTQIVGKSIEQSFVRSICTSLTVILVLLSLILFGPISTRYFAIMLITGMFFGTYSSIFLASPLLVLVFEWQNRK